MTTTQNLETPAGARKFLDELNVEPYGKATFVCLADGTKLKFAEMTDEQAVHYAGEIYRDIIEPRQSRRLH